MEDMSLFDDYGEVTYTVKAGDTLSKIANKYGTTYQKIAADNMLDNPDLIEVGQVLWIDGAVEQEVVDTPKAPAVQPAYMNKPEIQVARQQAQAQMQREIAKSSMNPVMVYGLTVAGLLGAYFLYKSMTKD